MRDRHPEVAATGGPRRMDACAALRGSLSLAPEANGAKIACTAELSGRLTSDPSRSSLGLLPSGPDPVGEWLVHPQPPGSYIRRTKHECKRRPRLLASFSPTSIFRADSHGFLP